jgi:hypothetical protein
MTIDEQIEDLQYQIRRIDGHSRMINIGNRIHGLLEIGIGAMWYWLGFKMHQSLDVPLDIPAYIIGTGFLLDGVGSAATGKLHYVLYRVLKVHPQYKLQQLESQREQIESH